MSPLAFPLPFMTALLAGILALRLFVTSQGMATARRIFAVLFTVMALRAVMVGLRFGYDITPAAALQPILAMMMPPLALLGFQAMSDHPPTWGWPTWALHGAPVALVVIGVAATPDPSWSWPIDLAVVASYATYAWSLMRLFRRGAAAFPDVDPDAVQDARRQLLVLSILMSTSAAVDLWIMVAFLINPGAWPLGPIAGAHALAVTTLVTVLILAPQRALGTLSGRVLSRRAVHADRQADAALVLRLTGVLTKEGLFRDPMLDAPRLARRLGVPLRRISEAVNGELGQNLSQFINGFRIEEACRRLSGTSDTVTSIMQDVGFETKSNFNREFRRVTGMSPTEWRKGRRPDHPQTQAETASSAS